MHFIIADEYADSTSLSLQFGFNNKVFLGELRNRGFRIINSRSNYNYTPFSVAAMLSMNYIEGLEGSNRSYPDRVKCAMMINKNPVWDFFRQHGYQLRNNSIFQIQNIPTQEPNPDFKIGIDFITSHTFLQRIWKDLSWHLVLTIPVKYVQDLYRNYTLKKNRNLMNRFENNLKQTGKPKFVYTHVHIPHKPYYFRHDGTPNPLLQTPNNNLHKPSYLEYLQYGNKVYLKMIDKILASYSKPPIIIFMGDHGYRQYEVPTPDVVPYYFMNLNAVYLPSGNYQPFYEGISGVNQFRALFNAAFGQSLPMLNDSTSFLNE
ncbi:sulfatase-like hydrolase/transferase [Flavisolibacter sp. BT320]|nr:sulfatase-like hydrolase/transferase [Flavisolibacter longurius]